MQKQLNKGFAQIFIIILLLAVLGGVIYFGMVKGKTSPIPTVSPISAPVTDTANWKKFNGKVFQYKYPNYLYAIDQNSNDTVFLYKDKQAADDATNCLKNHLGTIQNPCAFPLIQIGFSSTNDLTQVPKVTYSLGAVNYINYTNPQGVAMVKSKDTIGGMGLSTALDAFITKGPTVYRIIIETTPIGYWETYYPDNKVSADQEVKYESDLLNQILSTFKFLGQTTSAQTGTVTGKLCYPAESLPPGEIIAKDISTGNTFTQNFAGSGVTKSDAFSFQLPTGNYHLKYQAHENQADYSNFISFYYTACATNNDYSFCQSDQNHLQIPVKVIGNQTTTGVVLCDMGITQQQDQMLKDSF